MLNFASCPTIYRCQSFAHGKVRLSRHNQLYFDLFATAERFSELGLGIVICDLKVRDADQRRAAWEAGQQNPQLCALPSALGAFTLPAGKGVVQADRPVSSCPSALVDALDAMDARCQYVLPRFIKRVA
jgi:hypothetical protein